MTDFSFYTGGVNFNRFGEIVAGDSQITNTINDLIGKNNLEIKTDFNINLTRGFNKIEKNLKNQISGVEELVKAISVSKDYISFNNKRLVRVAKPIDQSDVVIKSELIDPKKITRAFDIVDSKDPTVHGSIEVKNHRRISKVSKAIDPFDVVVKSQLDETVQNSKDDLVAYKLLVSGKLQELERWKTSVASSFTELDSKFNDLKSPLR